jgi:hypothetical protein
MILKQKAQDIAKAFTKWNFWQGGSGDATQITYDNATSGLDATNLQDAVDEVNTEKQDKITGGASTITSDNLTSNKALISNTNGKVAVSPVTNTELGYLDGVSSNIQTQLNKKMNNNNPRFTGNMRGGSGCSIGGINDLLDSIVVNSAIINTVNGFYPAYSQADNWGSGSVLSKVINSNTNILFLVGNVSGVTDLPPGSASEWAFLILRDKSNTRQIVVAFGYLTSQVYVRYVFSNAWYTNWLTIHS